MRDNKSSVRDDQRSKKPSSISCNSYACAAALRYLAALPSASYCHLSITPWEYIFLIKTDGLCVVALMCAISARSLSAPSVADQSRIIDASGDLADLRHRRELR